jgi:ribosomal protein S3AE
MEFSLGDLNKEEDQAFRKIKLRVEDVKVCSGIAWKIADVCERVV